MTDPRIEIEAGRTRTEQDNENNNHQELEALMEENKKHEKKFWPGIEDEDAIPFACSPFFPSSIC